MRGAQNLGQRLLHDPIDGELFGVVQGKSGIHLHPPHGVEPADPELIADYPAASVWLSTGRAALPR